LALGRIPEWMSDENIAANNRHREWLKTPEAKALDLDRVSEDPDGSIEGQMSDIPALPGTDYEMMQHSVGVQMPQPTSWHPYEGDPDELMEDLQDG
jgi:hypothetical protein